MASKATEFVSGKLQWAKVLGEPVLNYEKTAREWTFELELNEKGIGVFQKHGLADRIKGKGFNIGQKGQFADRNPFIRLKKTELNRDGNKNPPIRIYDADDVEWDPELNDNGVATNLIGNGSGGDVKLDIRDYGPGKKKGVYPVAIRVTDHVVYESSEFGAMEEDEDRPAKPAKRAKKDTFKEDFGIEDTVGVDLDDEMPI